MGFIGMEMGFTYEDFRDNYLHSAELMPVKPLNPMDNVDARKLSSIIDNENIDAKVRNAFNKLENRMGDEYFSKFERVQSSVKEYGAFAFPPYKILFLDMTCEDWLSLLDFHKDFSRDHSVHQPLTAYIVCKLLGEGESVKAFKISGKSLLDKAVDVIVDGAESQYLRDRLSEKEKNPNSPLLAGDKELWKSVFYQTAIITAMFHDLGYPWQFIEKMHGSLYDDILLCGGLPENSPLVKEYIEQHKDELMFRPFYNYGKEGLTNADINSTLFDKYIHKSHGVTGALAYQKYNESFRPDVKNNKSGLIEFCQEWSCLAILMHDMQKAYTNTEGFPRLDFNTDPLSYIISLADTLEDFNRPNAEFKPMKKGCEIEYSFPSLAVKMEENNGVGKIIYKVSPQTKDFQSEQKLKDQKMLFDQPNGYFDLQSIGLSQMTIECEE